MLGICRKMSTRENTNVVYLGKNRCFNGENMIDNEAIWLWHNIPGYPTGESHTNITGLK